MKTELFTSENLSQIVKTGTLNDILENCCYFTEEIENLLMQVRKPEEIKEYVSGSLQISDTCCAILASRPDMLITLHELYNSNEDRWEDTLFEAEMNLIARDNHEEIMDYIKHTWFIFENTEAAFVQRGNNEELKYFIEENGGSLSPKSVKELKKLKDKSVWKLYKKLHKSGVRK